MFLLNLLSEEKKQVLTLDFKENRAQLKFPLLKMLLLYLVHCALYNVQCTLYIWAVGGLFLMG